MGRLRKGKKYLKKADAGDKRYCFGRKAKFANRYSKLECQRYYGDLYARIDDGNSEDDGWVCSCGYFVDSDFHCPSCGNEPPWGCDCTQCNERHMRPDDDDLIYGNIWLPDTTIFDQ